MDLTVGSAREKEVRGIVILTDQQLKGKRFSRVLLT